ncbi:uncharacterized protein N7498_008967 [Penicillium cinerascens]|uniref:Hemerythrin-like domain-containing protein n=1 Tax=Penicillium cinerascens TaxID=70096 RepID=A0A9W9JFP3_9EURO|nr:uncharacterized protein N7498_008967 [Penicillium cinerascens]KAJ5195529.1 hypothetical protein N7498_008967 [Penicillium cinerascens]
MAPCFSDAIKEDHREIEFYYDKIIHSSDKEEQVRFQNLFTWELARHSIGEELLVYPVFEKHLAGGADMANKDRKQHLKVKEQLKTFQDMTPSDTLFIPTIKKLMEDLSEHIKEEETDGLPKLEKSLSRKDSQSYAKCFGRTKMFVPSRSHPSGTHGHPCKTAVELLTAPIDHLADLFRKWPDTSEIPHPSAE